MSETDEVKLVPLPLIFWKMSIRDFTSEDIQNMATSLRVHGQIQPIVCKPPNKEGLYEGVVGRLRYEGAKYAKIPEVLVRVHKFKDKGEVLEWQLVENLHRKDLVALEKVNGYEKLLNLRKKRFREESAIEGIAMALGEPASTIAQYTEISRKIGNKARSLSKGFDKKKALNVKISHLQELSRVEDDDVQAELYGKVAAEGWTVKRTKEVVDASLKSSENVQKSLLKGAITKDHLIEISKLPKNKQDQILPVVKDSKLTPKQTKKIVKRSLPQKIVKRKFDVWNISGADLEKPFGDPDYPGAIPGDIVGNVLLWFLPNGGKVVDPMAGGGVTEDVCHTLGEDKYEVLLYDNKSLEGYSYRESVKFNDIEEGSLPKEAHGADLVFADPPYGPLKEYGFEPDRLYGILKGLAKASMNVLKTNAYVAVLMQNYYADGECVGDFIPLVRRTAEIFESFGFKQVFEVTVPLHGKVTRSKDNMTHIDRRLMVFQK